MLANRIFILVFSLLLASCGLKQVDTTRDWSASKLYTEAHEDLAEGNYESALQLFEKIQARFPYSKQARQAEIETIYAYYKYHDNESALEAAQRFINEHPDHPHLDYVYYMRGLVHYDKGEDLLSKLFPQDPALRDPKVLQESFANFAELLALFPNSKYAEDALQRMQYMRNKLAEHELHVGRFYYNRGAYVAAINRAKKVVENYQQTAAVPEALHMLKDSYTHLGMPTLAQRYQRIITHNKMQNYRRVTRDKSQSILGALRGKK